MVKWCLIFIVADRCVFFYIAILLSEFNCEVDCGVSRVVTGRAGAFHTEQVYLGVTFSLTF